MKKSIFAVLLILAGAGILIGSFANTAVGVVERGVDLLGPRTARSQIAMSQLETQRRQADADKADAEARPLTMREYWQGLSEYALTRGYVDQSAAMTASLIYLAEGESRRADQNRRFAFVAITVVAAVGGLGAALLWAPRFADALVIYANVGRIARKRRDPNARVSPARRPFCDG